VKRLLALLLLASPAFAYTPTVQTWSEIQTQWGEMLGEETIPGNLVLWNGTYGYVFDVTGANRLLVLNAVTNALSSFAVTPNGTGTRSDVTAYNASDPNNSSYVKFGWNAAGNKALFQSFNIGTGTAYDLSFNIGATENFRMTQTGRFGIGKTPGAALAVVGLTPYANNAAALAGGLTVGDCYTETGTNPLRVAVVY
jgi:hypothetical protein